MALRDWTKVEAQNIRETAAPLKIEAIKEFFENKNLVYIVDYASSQIKGNMFLTYLSNLDLNYEINLATATVQEKFDLLKIYMETRNLNASDLLRITVAELLMTYRGQDTSVFFPQPILTKEEKAAFIENNQTLFERWDLFLNSMYVFMVKSIPKLNEQLKVQDQHKKIEDPGYIGLNVVQMFSLPGFLDLYLSNPPQHELVYFKHQFEDYIFNGKNLFHYFYCPENTTFIAFSAIFKNEMSVDTFAEFAMAETEKQAEG
jgi:hypothetical protein